MQPKTFLSAIRLTFSHALRNGAIGFLIGGALIEVLAAFFNNNGLANFTDLFAPSAFTLFAHVTALLFALALFALCALWTITMRTIHGVFTVADDVVDALDGPNRHGLF